MFLLEKHLTNKIRRELRSLAVPEKAAFFPRFFKTSYGEYGYGDKFLGVTLPDLRAVAKNLKDAKLTLIADLLISDYHEERTLALILLVNKYKKADEMLKNRIFNFYIKKTKYINNWDLVDISADKIVGDYLFHRDKQILYEFAATTSLWKKRIAIISTLHFIKRNRFLETLNISKILFRDKEDLIHKAVGWMLREVGKRDRRILEKFLKENYGNIPRTTLRYAIEKFPEKLRKQYLTATY